MKITILSGNLVPNYQSSKPIKKDIYEFFGGISIFLGVISFLALIHTSIGIAIICLLSGIVLGLMIITIGSIFIEITKIQYTSYELKNVSFKIETDSNIDKEEQIIMCPSCRKENIIQSKYCICCGFDLDKFRQKQKQYN